MSTPQDITTSGLSLAPDSGQSKQPSELAQKAEALRQELLAGNTEPYVSELRTIAEQSADKAAASQACGTLCLYYHDTFHSLGKTDCDRALYYAETIKTLGPDYLGAYHGAMTTHFFAMYEDAQNEDNAREAAHLTEQCMNHAFEALKLGYQPTAETLTSNELVADVCTDWDPPSYWGVIYLAHRVRLQDPALTPLQREELEAAATALLETVCQRALVTEYTDYMAAHYPLEAQRARQANPPAQDAVLIARIAKLSTQGKPHLILTFLTWLCSGFTGAIISFLGHTFVMVGIGSALDLVRELNFFSGQSRFFPLVPIYTASAMFFSFLPNLPQFFLDRRPNKSFVQRLGPLGILCATIVGAIYLIFMPSVISSDNQGLFTALAFLPAAAVWLRTMDDY